MRIILTSLFLVFSYIASAQNTTKKITTLGKSVKTTLDTNRIVFDENDKPLRYYQYTKLLNTGNYTIKRNGSIDDPKSKMYLEKLNDADKYRMYQLMKTSTEIKSPYLKEEMQLNTTPLDKFYSPDQLKNKVIFLIFWYADCPPCTDSFEAINTILKKINNTNDLLVVAITGDLSDKALQKLKEKPLNYSDLISDARGIFNQYQLKSYPAYVVADKSGTIRFSNSGTSSQTIPALKNALTAVLTQ
jgi:peroxiredoxin